MGNHEDSAVAALAGQGYACNDWLAGGGRAALASWGVDSHTPREQAGRGHPRRPPRLHGVASPLPRGGPYLFIHAGLRPGLPVLSQLRDDLLRIRRSFLDSDADHGAIIVHGHTPTRDRKPEIRPTASTSTPGAVFEGGRLTCAILEGARLGITQT
jgi:serine/threonine protein phosphatase 1